MHELIAALAVVIASPAAVAVWRFFLVEPHVGRRRRRWSW